MRSLCLLAFGCLAGLFIYTYDLKLKTRALETEARDLASILQDESDFLALMRAEVSYLSRPERLEDMARKILKLEPISAAQLVSWNVIVSVPGTVWQTQVSHALRKDGIAALIEKAAPLAASRQ